MNSPLRPPGFDFMKGTQMLRTLPSGLPDLAPKLGLCVWSRRFSQVVPANIQDEETLGRLQRPLMYLRQNCTELAKCGVPLWLDVPDWSRPMRLDQNLCDIFSAAADLFDQTAGGDSEQEIHMRQTAVRTHKTIRAIRDVLKLAPNRQRTEGLDQTGAAQ